jgi:tetratricopeptide (TPR) repeat protein
MQDEIVARLTNALYPRLYAAEARRAERSVNPDAMDLVFQGWARYNKGATSENLGDARSFFERALAIDPTDLGGLVGVATVDMQLALSYLVNDRTDRLSVAEASLNKALAIAPDNSIANLCMGVLQIYTDRATAGVRLCERALELAPNLAMAHAYIGAGKLLLGQAEETETYVLNALRLSPRDTNAYVWCATLGAAKLHLGNDEDAVSWLRRSIEGNRNFPMSRFLLAAALSHLGRLEEARSEVKAGLAINPTFTMLRYLAGKSSANPAKSDRLVDGLRKAGVPEQ